MNRVIKDINISKYSFSIVVDLDEVPGCGREIYRRGIWEPNVTNMLLKILNEGDIFIDVGAAVGWYSFVASQIIGKKGSVFAFEPSKYRCDLILVSLKLNTVNNITLYNCGLSDVEEASTLGGKARDRIGFEGEVVNVMTLDSFSLAPDVMKIDVEGMEYKVLIGGRKTIEKHKPKILLETHHMVRNYGRKTKDVIALLNEYGYEGKRLGGRANHFLFEVV